MCKLWAACALGRSMSHSSSQGINRRVFRFTARPLHLPNPMRRLWSHRLLTLLQLTRMALVFTAIADGWCGLALSRAAVAWPGRASFASVMNGWQFLALSAVSIGLYGFGMSLNDIIDRRRDRQISPTRPIPSGRVSIAMAHLICLALLALALGAGWMFRSWGGSDLSISLVIVTLALIWFYDVAGKYLVGLGLVTLGLVRFSQALIPSLHEGPPYHPLVWHPLWLLNHVALLSAVCYQWEEKRPVLNIRHWLGVLLCLGAIDAGAIWLIGTRGGSGTFAENIHLDFRLLAPVAATLGFVLVARQVRRRSTTQREAGQATMLYGLLWLIVYDAVFAGLWAHWAVGVGILLLLPVAYFSVKVMRWWSKLLAASQRPEFKRAGS